jgi:hypothetical protein
MRLNLLASIALLCSSVLAAPTQLRRQETGPAKGLVDTLSSALGSLLSVFHRPVHEV